MPDIKGTNRAQTLFLRSFRKSPTGPAPEDWPSITLLRRWLRKPAFRTALDSLREALRFHADFQLTIGASQAVQTLVSTPNAALAPQDVRKLAELLRLAHLRQRFHAAQPALASPANFKLRDEIAELEEASQAFRHDREHPEDAPPADPKAQADRDTYERDLNQELQRLKSLVNPARQGSLK
jgi:hypothetical protein